METAPQSASTPAARPRNAWLWIPSLYFAEGLPYVVVMTVSVIMYKNLGVTNTEIALYTSWLYLPWVIKPFWSPLVDVLRTKRWWIVAMQLLIGAGLAGVAFMIPAPQFLQYTLAFLWLLAFSSATHDIAADGFYMLALSSHDQAWFVGIRSTFYRFAMIAGQGLLVILAGLLESSTGLPDLEFTVQATEQGEVLEAFDPPQAELDSDAGGLQLVGVPEQLQIVVQPRGTEQFEQLLEQVQQWNTSHGFYQAESNDSTLEATQKAAWIASLESFISRHFGPEEPPVSTSDEVGNIGIYFLQLNRPLAGNQQVVVNLQKHDDSEDIRIVQGERITFTSDNDESPAAVLLQLDRNLRNATSTSFIARSGDTRYAWATVFYIMAALFLAFAAYHTIALPHPERLAPGIEKPVQQYAQVIREFFSTFAAFFRKPGIVPILAFLLLYRFAEAQLVKMAAPFLLDSRQSGGLSLTTAEVGFVYGTVGIVMLTVGGILGGVVAARNGLKAWFWWMVLAMNLPNVAYVLLAYWRPENYLFVNLAVAVEQFGYGFGFMAYMLYMLYVSQGEHQTAHYAICTGFMALGMMLPGMMSGWLQELIGYENFFVWVVIATIPSFVACSLIPLDANFGKAEDSAAEGASA